MNPLTRPCRACRTPIAFVPGPNGRDIPLDLRAPVYEIVTDMTGAQVARPVERVHVSHFSTCPAADQFSKKGKV